MCVEFELAGHVEQDVIVVRIAVHIVVRVATAAQLGFQPVLVSDEVPERGGDNLIVRKKLYDWKWNYISIE